MSVSPRFSVVIPARNAARDLDRCLAALRRCRGERPAEVIVVDDGSTDDTAGVARADGAQVVTLVGQGPAAARNAGVRVAGGEVVVFFDADCEPEEGCLEALLARFADPAVGGVRGGYTGAQGTAVARFAQLEMEEKQARLAASPRVALVDTACAAYRRELFQRHGGFDESFRLPSVEDAEFSFRLVESGVRLVYAPEARVRHRNPEGLRGYCSRKFRFGFYRARLYARYPSRLGGDGYTPRLMPVQIGLAGLLVATLPAGLWWDAGRSVAVASLLALAATSLPLTARAWRSDRGLAPLVPAMVLARSLAQGFGLLAGFLVSSS